MGNQKHSPLEISMKNFPKFAMESNIYCMRETGTNLNTIPAEIQKFFGMNMPMGNVSLPPIRMYWQPATRIDRVADIMPVNRFLKFDGIYMLCLQENHRRAIKTSTGKLHQSSLLFARLAFNFPGKSSLN